MVIDDVIFPPIKVHDISLINMLSIKAIDFDVTPWEGCNISGPKCMTKHCGIHI